jgi:hypothetical protein
MTEKTPSGEETAIAEVSEAPEKCMTQSVLTVALKLRCLLHPILTDQFTAGIVFLTIGDSNIIYTEC